MHNDQLKILLSRRSAILLAAATPALLGQAKDPKSAMTAGRPVVQFEIGCKNHSKTTDFYAKLFGWQIAAPSSLASEIQSGSAPGGVQGGVQGIPGRITALGHEPEHYTIFYVDVEDVQATLDKAIEMGGKKLVGPIKLPTGAFAWFADPEGNMVGLLKQASTSASAELTPAEKQFQEMLSNVTLSGFFTVGNSGETHEDRYTIKSVTKGKDDQWTFDAQIQYGGKSYGAKVTVPVKWAGDAPVLSMAQYMIAGQGVYSARILMYNGMYSGTWGSQEHGGKMFGKIVKNDPAPAP